jgi:hypothetical protein
MMRRAHGTGAAALLRVETSPADELPGGVPDEARPESPTDRGEGGRFAGGNSLASRGGRARKGKTRLASSLGLAGLDGDESFAPYRRSADAFRVAQCASLASTVGAGECGPGPSSIVASAALALAASRYLYDTADGDASKLAQASRLADSSRQALLTAHELCAREAQARPKRDRINELLGRG